MKAEELLKSVIKDLDNDTKINKEYINNNIMIIKDERCPMYSRIENARELLEYLIQISHNEHIKSEYLNYKLDEQ
jgi:hypothetical protein